MSLTETLKAMDRIGGLLGKYSEDQPRDEAGRWTSEGGGAGSEGSGSGSGSGRHALSETRSDWQRNINPAVIPQAKADEFYAVRTVSPQELQVIESGAQQFGSYAGTAYQFWGATSLQTALDGVNAYHDREGIRDRNFLIVATPQYDSNEGVGADNFDPENGNELGGIVQLSDVRGVLNPRSGEFRRLNIGRTYSRRSL